MVEIGEVLIGNIYLIGLGKAMLSPISLYLCLSLFSFCMQFNDPPADPRQSTIDILAFLLVQPVDIALGNGICGGRCSDRVCRSKSNAENVRAALLVDYEMPLERFQAWLTCFPVRLACRLRTAPSRQQISGPARQRRQSLIHPSSNPLP